MENFLHKKFPDLQQSPEVKDAVQKHTRLTHEKVPNTPEARNAVYMRRLEKIFLNGDEKARTRNLEMLHDSIYDTFIIKPEDVPESYFELQQRVARERGQQVEEIPEETRRQMIEVIIEDQKQSLDGWIDYLTSPDAVYPTWFKYFAFRNIVKLSQFDKERGEFKQRSKSTTATFPDIYREALAQICDLYEKVSKGDPEAINNPEIQEYIGKKFPVQYAEAIQRTLEHTVEDREQIKGEWIAYSRGDMRGAKRLYDSLQSKGTGWCTAGESTARTQIEHGDFHVYYTYDADGNPTQPRIAIRMEGDQIGEVRGINPHQELEPIFGDILNEKLQNFGPEARKYQKKSADMKRLTMIEHKAKENQELTKEELIFLYEVESSIEGFGYRKDPRIQEIRKGRNLKEDIPILFDCTSEEIALKKEDITEHTKAYIGEWTPEAMSLLPENTQHIYEEFPNKKVLYRAIETDPSIKTAPDAVRVLEGKGNKVSDYAKQMLERVSFSQEQKSYDLVSFSVKALGFPNGATRAEIYQKAQELGMELCPAEVGPQLRLQYADQPNDDYLVMGMEPVADADGYPDLFHVHRRGSDPWLDFSNGRAGNHWVDDYRFVFLRRKN